MWPALLGAIPGIASAVGGIAGLFSHKDKRNDPTKAGMKYLNKIPASMSPYYQPYIDKGNAAGNMVGSEFNKMINDPGALYNKLGSGYQESPGYKFQLQNALQAGNNASAAGGMLGTPMHQQQNMQIGNDMAGADFEKYLAHMLGIYGGGITGEQGIANQGFDASRDYANMLGTNLGAKAQMAYQGADAKNQASAQNWQNIFSGLGAAGSGYNSYNQQKNFMDMMQKFYSPGGA